MPNQYQTSTTIDPKGNTEALELIESGKFLGSLITLVQVAGYVNNDDADDYIVGYGNISKHLKTVTTVFDAFLEDETFENGLHLRDEKLKASRVATHVAIDAKEAESMEEQFLELIFIRLYEPAELVLDDRITFYPGRISVVDWQILADTLLMRLALDVCFTPSLADCLNKGTKPSTREQMLLYAIIEFFSISHIHGFKEWLAAQNNNRPE